MGHFRCEVPQLPQLQHCWLCVNSVGRYSECSTARRRSQHMDRHTAFHSICQICMRSIRRSLQGWSPTSHETYWGSRWLCTAIAFSTTTPELNRPLHWIPYFRAAKNSAAVCIFCGWWARTGWTNKIPGAGPTVACCGQVQNWYRFFLGSARIRARANFEIRPRDR